MFRLFSRIPRLEPVSNIFKQVRSFSHFYLHDKACLVHIICVFVCSANLTIFLMQHVTAEGTALVKQAEDAASSKKVGLLNSIQFNIFR